MIQAIMLIALGFLTASLIGVLLAPSFWSRATRLSKKRVESTLPLTLAEVEAAQDQLRASYAVQVRRLESALASTRQKAASQLVDNSRLQMQIVDLKEQIGGLDRKLAERINAATVLEQTISKRFPALDREVTAVKAQLAERSAELNDATNKVSRREEELAAAQEAAAADQEELQRLHLVLEKSAADRSGRRVRRASQWNLEDFRAEYDRLNLELSRMRQELALYQNRDSQQVGVIKGELQKLADLILTSAQPKNTVDLPDRIEPFPKRIGPETRRERPVPWPRATAAMPLTQRLKLDAEMRTPVPSAAPSHQADAKDAEKSEVLAASSLRIPTVPAFTPLPEKVEVAAPVNGHAGESSRALILQDVVRDGVHEAEGQGFAESGTGDRDAGEKPRSNQLTKAITPLATATRIAGSATTLSQRLALVEAGEQDGDDALSAKSEISQDTKASAESLDGDNEEANLRDAIDLDALSPETEEVKVGPHLPRLLERLRSVGDDHAESEKPAPSHGL